ncbi:hypothetical protein [Actinophytocola sp.]|uniref:hypothetical protein n=1 Tax=Actinophytocola sp. TaxID=1872138 RepID=UPI00389ADD79
MFELVFDEKGGLRSAHTFADDVRAAAVTDLFVFSHGWNTSEDDARKTYDQFFPLVAAAAEGVAGLGKVGFASVFWPSLWFPDSPATAAATSVAAGSAHAAGAATQDRSGTDALSGTEIAESLALGFADPAQRRTVAARGRLIDETAHAASAGASDEAIAQRLLEFHATLRSLAPPVPDFEDAGERALLASTEPVRDYQTLAEVFGSTPAAGAQQGLGDWFGNAVNGAKDALRVFSYTTMKARAGTIGRTGLGPQLAKLRGVRVHLIGHSFGARLVSFALAGVGPAATSPVASLLLLQGAFSHWSFAHAKDNPFGADGTLHGVVDRVRGPLVATFSVHDFAVCRWYPKASCLARQDESATVGDRWGGMGSDGFQAVAPVVDKGLRVEGGTGFGFRSGTFYRVNANNVISNEKLQGFAGAHNDFQKPAVAQLAVAAAAHS